MFSMHKITIESNYDLLNIFICLMVTYIYYCCSFVFSDNYFKLILKFFNDEGILSSFSILSAFFLFMVFAYLKISSETISYISKYTFYVYLFHMIFSIIYSYLVRNIYYVNVGCRLSLPIGGIIIFLSLFY